MKFDAQLSDFVLKMRSLAKELGFSALRISDVHLPEGEARLTEWLASGYHGDMQYMAAHGMKRCRPDELLPGTLRVVSLRMDYLPEEPQEYIKREMRRKHDPLAARISMYARGRDYHRVLRNRLARLAEKMKELIGTFEYRVFTDSAPVMEVAFAAKSGMGWQGKNNLLINARAGSFFFLGEIYIDLPLPVDEPETSHCGRCTRCMENCPTGAIVSPSVVDARRCISYLTIESKGPIPPEMRPLLGNRIYGCDDCQLICPWNGFAQKSVVEDFNVRNGFDECTLLDVSAWSEAEFLAKTEGSPIRRIGYERWCRNIAVALGNLLHAGCDEQTRRAVLHSLNERMGKVSDLVDEHIGWAFAQDLKAQS